MNELERLIAALPRPEPGEKLDERIDALLVRQPILRRKMPLAWLVTAACSGVLGFFLGRQSVAVSPPSAAVIAVAPASNPPPEVAPAAAKVTNIPLSEDQLGGLLARPAPREGMFGRGPMTIEISPSR